MAALPCPVELPLIETQLASLVTVQVQSRVVETVTVPVPPVEGKDGVELLTWI
jgi:hypothetical protein